MSNLFAKETFQYRIFRHFFNGRKHALPVVQERLQVVPSQGNAYEVLKLQECSVCFANLKMFVNKEKNLSSLHQFTLVGKTFLDEVDAAREFS